MVDPIHILDAHHIVLTTVTPPHVEDLRLTATRDPDIPLVLTSVEPGESATTWRLTTEATLDTRGSYQLVDLAQHRQWELAPSLLSTVLSVILAAALVQNFVFTRYLGLCVFFGVSRKRETALGMGVTFTLVGLCSGLLAWLVDRFALRTFHLGFLQIIIFIGIVACLVQLVDTIMKKVHRGLHKKFGIYVVLITTNCIILAVPLLNAMANSGLWPSLALALGSGLGFALALFLMSCARERADLAPVPAIFRGMPIAFILAGLFALAFLGFSGLQV
ncbi:MAG: NADH-quinone reductase [Deltaproteobacteria bacterium]|nr:NADH-quinone reductase [Deltaproteobacteria bacterium]